MYLYFSCDSLSSFVWIFLFGPHKRTFFLRSNHSHKCNHNSICFHYFQPNNFCFHNGLARRAGLFLFIFQVSITFTWWRKMIIRSITHKFCIHNRFYLSFFCKTQTFKASRVDNFTMTKEKAFYFYKNKRLRISTTIFGIGIKRLRSKRCK